MLEIVNQPRRALDLDHFLTYLGMYEDARRAARLRALLTRHRAAIREGVCVEAGAGLGLFTDTMLSLGARRVYCVEENPFCCRHLRERFGADARVRVIRSRIEDFRPRERIDVLFHELYGPMLLDESLLALERLRFRPRLILPDGGRLLLERVLLVRTRDRLITPEVLRLLDGALVTDLFPGFRFRRPRAVLEWRAGEPMKRSLTFRVPASKHAALLAFGMEITHRGQRVCGTSDCRNWPYVFTPARSGTFELGFSYRDCFAEVRFRRTGTGRIRASKRP